MYIPFEECAAACSLENFFGAVHIGAAGEQYAKAYEKNDFQNILWVEPKQENMSKLYTDTRNTSLNSKYFNVNLTDANTYTFTDFEKFVRKNIVEINLDQYDLVVLDLDGGEKETLEGFGPLLTRFPFRAVYTNVNFSPEDNGPSHVEELDKFLFSQGFERKLTVETENNKGEALYVR